MVSRSWDGRRLTGSGDLDALLAVALRMDIGIIEMMGGVSRDMAQEVNKEDRLIMQNFSFRVNK